MRSMMSAGKPSLRATGACTTHSKGCDTWRAVIRMASSRRSPGSVLSKRRYSPRLPRCCRRPPAPRARANPGCRGAGPRDSASFELRLALLHEGARRLAMVLGHAGAGVVPGLEIELVLERARLGGVHVALHVAEGDARPVRDLPRERHRLLLELAVGNDAVDDAERQGLVRVH